MIVVVAQAVDLVWRSVQKEAVIARTQSSARMTHVRFQKRVLTDVPVDANIALNSARKANVLRLAKFAVLMATVSSNPLIVTAVILPARLALRLAATEHAKIREMFGVPMANVFPLS